MRLDPSKRMDCRLDHVPTVMRVFDACMQLDAFAKTHGVGTAFGNTVVRKYTGSTRFVKPSTSRRR